MGAYILRGGAGGAHGGAPRTCIQNGKECRQEEKVAGTDRRGLNSRGAATSHGERIPKKIARLSSTTKRQDERERVQIIDELRHKYKLKDLLALDGMARSTFYYHLKRMKQPDKHSSLTEKIKEIFYVHQKRYGYRRITMELHQCGIAVNHKLVQKIMKKCGLVCIRRKSKYKSYRGVVGHTAPNIIELDFHAEKPLQKLTTDVSEFAVADDKVYLSPVLDMYNGEIIAYDISTHPNFEQTMNMLDRAFKKIPDNSGAILHSDQGWQYQMKQYQQRLKEKGIIQSMSRKGNCFDNAIMGNFFGILKNEMFYGRKFRNAQHLITEIDNYIYYYNNDRIKLRLKGMSPVQYRTHFA